eukprot:227658-Rhodomonas_salina.1
MRHIVVCVSAMRCPVHRYAVLCYAFAPRCPVLTLLCATPLPTRSSTCKGGTTVRSGYTTGYRDKQRPVQHHSAAGTDAGLRWY